MILPNIYVTIVAIIIVLILLGIANYEKIKSLFVKDDKEKIDSFHVTKRHLAWVAIGILSLCVIAIICWGIDIFIANYAEIIDFKNNMLSSMINIFAGIAFIAYVIIFTVEAIEIYDSKDKLKEKLDEYIKLAATWLAVIVIITLLLNILSVSFFKAMAWFALLSTCSIGIFFIYQRFVKSNRH